MANKIRKVTIEDVTELQEISAGTFRETFGADNKAEDIDAYMERAFSVEQLEKELANDHSLFYFVVKDQEVAGYLKVNMNGVQSEEMGADALEVERIYVSGAFQKLGFGRALLDKAFEVAREYGKSKVWLGVWEKNEGAIAFYRRKGFVKTGAHSFFMGDDEQTDYIMVKALG